MPRSRSIHCVHVLLAVAISLMVITALSSLALAETPGVRIVASVDGEELLDHTFHEDVYADGTVMFVLVNGVMRFDDVRVTSATGDVVFEDDFEGERLFAFPSLWERGNAGVWMIVDEDGNKVLEQSDTERTGLTDLWPLDLDLGEHPEYTFEFSFKLLSWNGNAHRVNFIPRGMNRNDAYMIQYSDLSKSLGITHREPGKGDSAYFDSVSFEIEAERWYRFSIHVSRAD